MNKKHFLIILSIITLYAEYMVAADSTLPKASPFKVENATINTAWQHLTTFKRETLVSDSLMGLEAATPIALYGGMVFLAPRIISSIPIDDKTACATIFGLAPAAAEITGGPAGLLTYCTIDFMRNYIATKKPALLKGFLLI